MSEVNQAQPALSVILITPDKFARIRKTVRLLRAQTVHDRLEVVVGAPSLAELDMDEAEREGFAGLRLAEVGPLTSTGEPRLRAMQAATAPLIMFGEDHCFPEPGWAEALLAAFDQGYHAVGATLLNANPGSRVSWASILLNFAPVVACDRNHTAAYIAWHNSGYRRKVLDEYSPEEMAAFLEAEGILHGELEKKGHKLLVCADARTHHTNVSLFRGLLVEQFWGSRLFWSARVDRERWPLGKRLIFAAASPGLILVRLLRAATEARRMGELGRLPLIAPHLAAGAVCVSLGAAAALLRGRGNTMHWRVLGEFHRVNELRPEDRPLLTS